MPRPVHERISDENVLRYNGMLASVFDLLAPGGLRTTELATRYQDASTYNNYYEFGTAKDQPARAAQGLRTRPWSVEVAGHAEKTGTFALEDLLRYDARDLAALASGRLTNRVRQLGRLIGREYQIVID